MIVNLYSVQDKAARSFGSPMVFVSHEMAERGCRDLYREGGDAPMILYPMDFDVYHIGVFDTDIGVMVGVQTPSLVVRFSDIAASFKGE